MAEGKKGIIIYADWLKKFEALEDDEAGRLIKHFFRFVNDLNPKAPDRITELSFIDIEQSLKRDLVKWENKANRSRENGKLGGRPVKEEPTITQQVILEPKEPVSVSVSDNVSVSVSERVNTENFTLDENKKDFVLIKTEKEEKEKSCEKKEKENPLGKSNLFRQPNIPTQQQVYESFINAGGTEEMAKKFYNTNEGTGWFSRGSPITNYRNFIPGYISSWQKNNHNGSSNNTKKFGSKSAGFGIINDAFAELERGTFGDN